MNPNDETLMAYADGELPQAQRALLEQALSTDEALRQRVQVLRQQRSRLAAAFHPVLDEPVPDRLTQLLGASPTMPVVPAAAPVIDLAKARAKRESRLVFPAWAQWGGMAASLLLGMVLTTLWQGRPDNTAMALAEGRLLASGPINKALSQQLAQDSSTGHTVSVQLSFVDKQGNYCRTFSTAAVAGLACRKEEGWVVENLAAQERTTAGAVRPAATALPPAILAAVDERIAANALPAAAERDARDHGWRH